MNRVSQQQADRFTKKELALLLILSLAYGFILVGCILFMVSYITISTFTQTLVNDIADSGYRGTINGIFNSIQYLGSFIGSLTTGALWGNSHVLALGFTLAAALFGVAIMHETYSLKANKFKDTIEEGIR